MDKKTRIDSTPDAKTRVDRSATAETVLESIADAETHKLDPRVYAPLRVCPQCSLAWETESDWCASCGTAFDARDRESVTRVRPGRTGERPAARNARARRAAPNSTRNTGERAAAHQPARRTQPARGKSVAAPRRRSIGSFVGVLALFLLIPVAALAFIAGQNTRPTKAEVNDQIATATAQTKQAARASFQRNFERQRERLQTQFEKAAAAAQKQGYEQGKANAEANLPETSLPDDLKRCLSSFLIDC
jgi:hypothetical protein